MTKPQKGQTRFSCGARAALECDKSLVDFLGAIPVATKFLGAFVCPFMEEFLGSIYAALYSLVAGFIVKEKLRGEAEEEHSMLDAPVTHTMSCLQQLCLSRTMTSTTPSSSLAVIWSDLFIGLHKYSTYSVAPIRKHRQKHNVWVTQSNR